MRTINVAISDLEYSKYGIKNNILSFSDFVDIISKELMKDNLIASVTKAEKCGLSSMTMDEITNEVKAVRQNAKNSN